MQQVDRLHRVVFVDLHVAADRNVPVQPLLEHAIAQAVHFGNFKSEFPETIALHHVHHGFVSYATDSSARPAESKFVRWRTGGHKHSGLAL